MTGSSLRTIVLFIVLAGAMFVTAAPAGAEDIRGIIVRTLVLSEDSRLIGDVTCQVTGAAPSVHRTSRCC